ncbi:hypothetical protein [Schinkia azotoformans]|uniref:hypothetical protein n=1 Tax=Schinkia azotoformans TaxID=1454 RepID=UPI002DBF7EF7|nr:hypothetical protein [Schinkia azotoformans]MEC1718903.1 hypothetical protein [Schinkia azotoformans]MED4412885.1 hypothetical protein [Schinkia azotoformans]
MQTTAKVYIKTKDIFHLNYGEAIFGQSYVPEENGSKYMELIIPIDWIHQRQGFFGAFSDEFIIQKVE